MYPKKKELPLKNGDRFYRREQGYNQAIDDFTKELKERVDVEKIAELIWGTAPTSANKLYAQAIQTHFLKGLE